MVDFLKKTEMVSAALKDVRAFLQNDSLQVFILPADPGNSALLEKMGGVMGLTAGSKRILIFIDTEIEEWEENLKYTVAHEFHHACWTKNNFSKITRWTLAEYLVFEGKADSFAHLVYPDVNAPWTYALPENVKKELWPVLRDSLGSARLPFHQEIMFGSEKYPMWTGYTFGYEIMQKYLKTHNEMPVEVWSNLPADSIIIR